MATKIAIPASMGNMWAAAYSHNGDIVARDTTGTWRTGSTTYRSAATLTDLNEAISVHRDYGSHRSRKSACAFLNEIQEDRDCLNAS